MIREHHSTETDPFERGHEFGRAQRAAVENTVLAYERLFAAVNGLPAIEVDELGQRVSARLARTVPTALAEIQGIAVGAGVSAERLVAINARTEILAGAGLPECSVIGAATERSGGDGALLAQNWDWHPDAAASLVLWTVVKPGGGWFRTLTEAGILAKIGLNDHGLGLCINILASSDDGADVVGLPIHVMLRLLLEHCDDLEGANELLRSNAYAASTAITVATAGDLRTFEVSPRGVRIMPAVGGVLTHTNHFLMPIGEAADLALRDWPDSIARLASLGELANGDAPVDGKQVKEALRSHTAQPLVVCLHDPDNPQYENRQQTLASVVMHLDDRRIELAPGPPCAIAYVAIPPH